MALKTIRDAVRGMCSADPSITQGQIKHIMAILDGEDGSNGLSVEPMDKIMTPRQTAKTLAVSTKTITRYARMGLLKGVTFGDRRGNFHGYTASSVRALMEGRTVPTARNPTGLVQVQSNKSEVVA